MVHPPRMMIHQGWEGGSVRMPKAEVDQGGSIRKEMKKLFNGLTGWPPPTVGRPQSCLSHRDTMG
eukprot:5545583-Karenia_brevis.AAC.1